MIKRFSLLWALLSLPVLSASAFAVKPSWWGGEIQAVQTSIGFGYGKYEVEMIPGTGVGSISGFFNLCYSNNHQDCIDYSPQDDNHFETDVEFTPTGDEKVQRRWLTTPCLTDSSCNVTTPSPWPRDNAKNLLAVSFNTFPQDNQVYFKMNPYTTFHTYTFVNLPNEVYWEVDGVKTLSRVPSSPVAVRNFPKYKLFENALKANRIKLIINIWDGSQGGQGGFGGGGNVQQTEGTPARIRRVAYYPANCNNGNCTISSNPAFLTDFVNGKFIRNNGDVPVKEGLSVCAEAGRTGPLTLWTAVKRDAYPVYVAPSHVNCTYTKNGDIKLRYAKTP